MEGPRGLKLKLDENLSRRLKEPLVDLGFDATTVVEPGFAATVDELGNVIIRRL